MLSGNSDHMPVPRLCLPNFYSLSSLENAILPDSLQFLPDTVNKHPNWEFS